MFLIVDDEPDMCWALEHILKKNRFRVKKALSGEKALALIRSNRFHLALLDAKLPDMEGLDLAVRIREADPSIRVIMVSGYFYGDDVPVQKALEEGVICGFIAKPFIHEEILKAIQNASLPETPP